MINKFFNALPLISTVIFLIWFYFSPTMLPLYLSGLFMMIAVLSSIKKMDPIKIILIISPIFTYPALFFVLTQSSWKNSTVYIVLYSVIYGLLFKNLWKWVEPKKRKSLIASLVLLTIITLFYGRLFSCYSNFSETTGLTQQAVLECRQFALYGRKPGSNLVRLVLAGPSNTLTSPLIQGPIFISIIVVFTLIFFEVRERYRTKNK